MGVWYAHGVDTMEKCGFLRDSQMEKLLYYYISWYLDVLHDYLSYIRMCRSIEKNIYSNGFWFDIGFQNLNSKVLTVIFRVGRLWAALIDKWTTSWKFKKLLKTHLNS